MGQTDTGSAYHTIGADEIRSLAQSESLSIREAELLALERGMVPLRYLRNLPFLNINAMRILRQSTVGICGVGGVGGFVVEYLARLGIGKLVIADDDVFIESNLNRQLYATEKDIGRKKAEIAQERVRLVNASTETECWPVRIEESNGATIFRSCDVLVSCVDNVHGSLALEAVARELGIAMIHGEIGNTVCRWMMITPGSDTLQMIYALDNQSPSSLGSPVISVAMCAGLQVGEVLKQLGTVRHDPAPAVLKQLDWLRVESESIQL